MFAQINKKELITLSWIKRFFEKWHGDPAFRKQVSKDPAQAVFLYDLKIDPEEIRLLWDTEYSRKQGEKVSISPAVKLFQKFPDGIPINVYDIKSLLASPKDTRFKAWRERQIARNESLQKKSYHDLIAHAPVAFELSKGCSVGCWFCGVSAPRLSDLFLYTPANAKLWREILGLLQEILGLTAGTGICYWATDPLDNPHYEKFCSDFHEILGRFPQTTTALASRNPARTRSLLKLSRKKGCETNRFSVLSLKMLEQIHQEFSAEELAFVKLVLQNPESDLDYANAGRIRERNKQKTDKFHENNLSNQGTIACVSGFLFNMVDRTVKLISPCQADDRWPLGYIVFDQGSFSNINDLKALLERMMEEHMSPTVKPNDLIRFRPDLQYKMLPDGFQLSTRFMTHKFRHHNYLKELGEAIRKGDKTVAEIVRLFNFFGVPSENTFQALNLLLASGCLDKEPKSFQ